MSRSKTIKSLLGSNARVLNENLDGIVKWSKSVNELKSKLMRDKVYK